MALGVLAAVKTTVLLFCVDAVSLQIDTMDWEKYNVYMLRAEVH
jgi:hypothetical protein